MTGNDLYTHQNKQLSLTFIIKVTDFNKQEKVLKNPEKTWKKKFLSPEPQ